MTEGQTCRNKALQSPLVIAGKALRACCASCHSPIDPSSGRSCLPACFPIDRSGEPIFHPSLAVPFSRHRWPRLGPTWLSMRQIEPPGIEAGIRITHCLCALSYQPASAFTLRSPRRVGKKSTTNPSPLSICGLITFLFLFYFFVWEFPLLFSCSPPTTNASSLPCRLE